MTSPWASILDKIKEQEKKLDEAEERESQMEMKLAGLQEAKKPKPEPGITTQLTE